MSKLLDKKSVMRQKLKIIWIKNRNYDKKVNDEI